MRKTFCDCCEQEITKENEIPSHLVVGKTSFIIEPSSTNGTIEDICLYCFIKTLNKLDKREKCAEPDEKYIKKEFLPEVIGWAYSEFCMLLDKDEDPRVVELPEILEKAQRQILS